MTKTLYNLTVEDAKTLVKHFSDDAELLGLFLWNNKRASTLERGIYKAKKIIKLSKEA